MQLTLKIYETSVIIETQSNSMDVTDIFNNLIVPALLGSGIGQAKIDRYLEKNHEKTEDIVRNV